MLGYFFPHDASLYLLRLLCLLLNKDRDGANEIALTIKPMNFLVLGRDEASTPQYF